MRHELQIKLHSKDRPFGQQFWNSATRSIRLIYSLLLAFYIFSLPVYQFFEYFERKREGEGRAFLKGNKKRKKKRKWIITFERCNYILLYIYLFPRRSTNNLRNFRGKRRMKTITTAEMSEIMLNAFYTISDSKVDISENRICPQPDNANCRRTRTQSFQIRGERGGRGRFSTS